MKKDRTNSWTVLKLLLIVAGCGYSAGVAERMMVPANRANKSIDLAQSSIKHNNVTPVVSMTTERLVIAQQKNATRRSKVPYPQKRPVGIQEKVWFPPRRCKVKHVYANNKMKNQLRDPLRRKDNIKLSAMQSMQSMRAMQVKRSLCYTG